MGVHAILSVQTLDAVNISPRCGVILVALSLNQSVPHTLSDTLTVKVFILLLTG